MHYIGFNMLVSLIYTLHWIAIIILKDMENKSSYYSKV